MPQIEPRISRPIPTCHVLAGLLGIMLLFAPTGVSGQEIDGYLEDVRAEYGLPALAAAVVQDGAIVAAAAVGTRTLGGAQPVTITDRFHLGSNTKAMTATLAGMMVECGKLRWDSTVGEVLSDDVPGMSVSLAGVTLGQLLSHSSGIPSDNEQILDLYFSVDVFDYNPTDLRRRLLDQWKTTELAVPDGSPFQYSNLGYVIAGLMIEKVAGEPWEQLMYERIFAPLDLQSAGLGPQATYGLIDAPVGHGIAPDGTVTPMLWGPAADVPQIIAPAGNAHMSILDYATWAGWNAGQGTRGPALVTPETLNYIQSVLVDTPVRDNPPPGTPGTGSYGLGWGIVTFDWSDGPVLTHNGSNSMNLARIIIDPTQDLAIVAATNYPGAQANAAAGAVLQHLYAAHSAK